MVDLVQKTADELNLPREQVQMVVSDLFKAIREYIREIHTMKFGILLPYFRINIKPSVIWDELTEMRRLRDLEHEGNKAHYEYLLSILKGLPFSEKTLKDKYIKKLYDPSRLDSIERIYFGREYDKPIKE